MSAWAAATRARCSAESSTTSTAPFFTGWPSLNSSVSMRPSISGRSTTLSSAISAPTALTVFDTGVAATFIMLTGMKGGPPAWAKASARNEQQEEQGAHDEFRKNNKDVR